jgi:hypothetical protein
LDFSSTISSTAKMSDMCGRYDGPIVPAQMASTDKNKCLLLMIR